MGSISLKADLTRTIDVIYEFFFSSNTFHICNQKLTGEVPDIFVWMIFKIASGKNKIIWNLPGGKKCITYVR